MMVCWRLSCSLFVVYLFDPHIAWYRICESVELTFELPDSAKECFYEVIEKDTESTLEFQVSVPLPGSTKQNKNESSIGAFYFNFFI